MARHYIFDKENAHFKKATRSVWGVVKSSVIWLIRSLTLAVIYYVIGSLFISTDTEKRINKENRAYEKEYARLKEEAQLVGDVVEALQAKDDGIYMQVFHSAAPLVNPTAVGSYLEAADTIPDKYIVKVTEAKASSLVRVAAQVDADFEDFTRIVSSEGFVLPPFGVPVKDLSYAQIGASVGMKVNPFYKVPVQHNGLDLLVPQGVEVFVTASGTVTDVIRSRKGQGNVVSVDHGNGWVTRYAHLGDIIVRKGQTLSKGQKIGAVGMTGNSFAPHLHYEVLFGEKICDPVYYLLEGMDKDEYADNVYMSINTKQSMD